MKKYLVLCLGIIILFAMSSCSIMIYGEGGPYGGGPVPRAPQGNDPSSRLIGVWSDAYSTYFRLANGKVAATRANYSKESMFKKSLSKGCPINIFYRDVLENGVWYTDYAGDDFQYARAQYPYACTTNW